MGMVALTMSLSKGRRRIFRPKRHDETFEEISYRKAERSPV